MSRVAELKGPVLVELCQLVDATDVVGMTDADLYSYIVFAARLKHSRSDFSASEAPELDAIAHSVLGRLGSGWFARSAVTSPQAWFSDGNDIHSFVVTSEGSALSEADKPVGAMWTASYLPDGRSAWGELEAAEFPEGNRRLYSIRFKSDAVRSYTINCVPDYQRLLSLYPRSEAGWVGVNWRLVAEQFDAVRLSPRGLVSAHDFTIRTPQGVAVLRGWDSEATAWLRRPPGVVVEA